MEKTNTLMPLFKKVNRLNPEKFRSINLLNTALKLVTKTTATLYKLT